MDLGLPQYWWKEEDLISGKSHATTRAHSTWTKNVGTGRRLDGKPPAAGNCVKKHVSEMTEDEMLQAALAASMEESAPSSCDRDELTE